MSIVIEAISKSQMRYDTLGDWFTDERGHIHIQVDESLSADEQFLIAIHELVELKLCSMRGITQQAVDEFDLQFLGKELPGEPGDHPDAPYRVEHRQAMILEHMMAGFMGLFDYGRIE